MKNNTGTELYWHTSEYGECGRSVWVLLFGWIGLVFLYVYLLMIFSNGKFIEYPVQSSFVIIIFSILVASGPNFFFQSLHTCYRISVDSEGMFTAKTYLRNNEVLFSVNDILNVDEFHLGKLARIYTPLHQYDENYKINLKNGSYLYLSASMPEINSLLKIINKGEG